jgi:hypothetical protein
VARLPLISDTTSVPRPGLAHSLNPAVRAPAPQRRRVRPAWTATESPHARDVTRALAHVAPNQRVDEDQLLRPKLGAVLAAAFLGMDQTSSDGQLNALAKGTIGADAEVFKLSNRSKDDLLRIEVQFASPLFRRDTFPFEVGRDDNTNIIR